MWLSFAKPQYSATALVQFDSGNKFSNFDNVVTSAREGDPDANGRKSRSFARTPW